MCSAYRVHSILASFRLPELLRYMFNKLVFVRRCASSLVRKQYYIFNISFKEQLKGQLFFIFVLSISMARRITIVNCIALLTPRCHNRGQIDKIKQDFQKFSSPLPHMPGKTKYLVMMSMKPSTTIVKFMVPCQRFRLKGGGSMAI